MARYPTTKESYLYLSISRSPGDATGPWCNYKFGYNHNSTWHDYPKLAVDGKGIYITSNKFDWSNNFSYAAVRAFRKAELTNNTTACPSLPTSWTWASEITNEDGSTPYTIQPAQMLDKTSSDAYLVNAHASMSLYPAGNALTLWRMSWNASNVPSLARLGTLAVSAYSLAPDARQKDSTYKLDTHDGRLLNAAYRNGIIWTTHVVKSTSYAGSAVRVYSINPSTLTATFSRQIHGSGLHFYNSSVMPSYSGIVMVVFNRSGANDYPDIWYQVKVGTWSPSYLIKPADGPFFYNYSGRTDICKTTLICRWGDYAGSAADDANDTIWLYNEYGKGSGNEAGTWLSTIY